jgi:hypothetical protein
LGAGDSYTIFQVIEGWRVARLAWGTGNAQPITIGFWSAHHRTGLYSGTIRNSPPTRSYAFTYTQAVADAVQYNTVTIPGCTDGTWATDNTGGMTILFAGACGTTLTAPSANSWLVGNYVAAPGQVNGIATSSDFLRFGAVVVLPGSEAPSAARSPFIMRPYDQELVTCQRYWEKVFGAYRQTTTSGGFASVLVPYKVIKRSSPTGTFLANGATAGNSTFQAFNGGDSFGTWPQFQGTANTDSYNFGFTISVDARL